MNCNCCSNCIPEENFLIHEATCKKNYQTCAKCNKIIPKFKMQQHLDSHVHIKCEYCNVDFEQGKIADHPCKNPLTTCEYCELKLPLDQFFEHFNYCQHRTNICEKCNLPILNKDLKAHLQLPNCTINIINPIIPQFNYNVNQDVPSFNYDVNPAAPQFNYEGNPIILPFNYDGDDDSYEPYPINLGNSYDSSSQAYEVFPDNNPPININKNHFLITVLPTPKELCKAQISIPIKSTKYIF